MLAPPVSFLETIQNNYLILLIPPISAFVGWFTNWLAVRMMFFPTEFIGLKPFLGWQGLVPAGARRLAQLSTQLIMEKLLRLEDLFEGFDADGFGDELDAVVDDITEQIIQDVAVKRAGPMWGAMAEDMQSQIRDQIRVEVKKVCVAVVGDFAANINDILDLERVVVDTIVADKKILTAMFLKVGEEEFKFIERSGIWFGGLFGLIQMAVWILYPAWWILPLAGFMVGYATNWLALKLIFEPQQPKKIGPATIQGLFHKRQAEVAAEFSRLVAKRVLNADNIVRTVSEGTTGDNIIAIIEKHIGALVEQYEQHPMAAMLVPPDERDALRAELVDRIKGDMKKPGGFLHVFAGKSIDIRDELESKMTALDPESFEGVLRPAFQQDEWKLIVAGAVLGLGAGVLQVVYIFGEMVLA